MTAATNGGVVAFLVVIAAAACHENPRPIAAGPSQPPRDQRVPDAKRPAAASAALETLYGCGNGEALAVEFVDESLRDPRNARCALGGEYTFENFCAVVKALKQKGHHWDMVFVIPKDASDSRIRISQYKGPGYGESLYVNPRDRGQVIVGEDREQFEYCVEISPARIRFVLIGVIAE